MTDATLVWVVEAAYNLSNNGTVGLGALMKSFSSPEVQRWFVDTQSRPNDLPQFLKMLRWVLGFPSAYMVSEGINRIRLEKSLMQQSTTWIELRTEYFERYEHQVVAVLLNAAIEDAVWAVIDGSGNDAGNSRLLTIVHLFPLASGLTGMPEWVKETAHSVRHIGVHTLRPERPLNPLLMSWVTEASTVWVAGKLSQPLNDSVHGSWLNAKEIEQINELDRSGIWAKSNDSGKTIVARVHPAEEYLGLADRLRRQCSKFRKIMPLRQAVSALASIADPDAGERYMSMKMRHRLPTIRLQHHQPEAC